MDYNITSKKKIISTALKLSSTNLNEYLNEKKKNIDSKISQFPLLNPIKISHADLNEDFNNLNNVNEPNKSLILKNLKEKNELNSKVLKIV